MNERDKIILKDYEISKYDINNNDNVIWIVNKDGEGTQFNIRCLFDSVF